MKRLFLALCLCFAALEPAPALSQAKTVHDMKAEAAYREGRFEFAYKRFHEAVQKMEKAGGTPKSNYQLRRYYFLRAGALRALGHHEEASHQVRSALKKYKLSIWALGRDLVPVVIEAASFRLRQDPNDWDSLYWRAEAYASTQIYDLAIEDHSKRVELARTDKERAEALAGRSWPLRLAKQDDRALEDLSAAIKLERNPDFFINRSRVHKRLGNLQMAIMDISEGIALSSREDRTYTGLLVERAKFYEKSGAGKLALADLKTALDLKPDDQSILGARAIVLFKQGAFGLAALDLDTIKEKHPKALKRLLPKLRKIQREQKAQRFEKLMSSKIAGKAMGMGAAVTMVPIQHMLGKHDDSARKHWARLAKFVNKRAASDANSKIVPLDRLPKLTGTNKEKLRATIDFIGKQRGKVLKALVGEYGKDGARLLAFSSLGNLIISLRRLGFSGSLSRPVQSMKKAANSMGMPADVYASFLKAAGGADHGNINAEWKLLVSRIENLVNTSAKMAEQ